MFSSEYRVLNKNAWWWQITYQLKILTTAMFAVTMLGKKLIPTQAGAAPPQPNLDILASIFFGKKHEKWEKKRGGER